jgi:hypothetical protein
LLVLLFYWLPLPRFLLLSNESWLASTITIQLALVISCNILVSEPWKYGVILIEAFCMLFNVTYFLTGDLLSGLHAQIMLTALIIELLIITISMQGAAIGITSPMAGSRLRDLRRAALYRHSCDGVA